MPDAVVTLLALLVVMAFAVDPAPAPPVTPPAPTAPPAPGPSAANATSPPADDEASDEVIVYGEHLVEQARRKVEAELVSQGYDQVARKDGYTRYRHDSTWKGEVRVYDDGWVQMRRQPIRVGPPEGLHPLFCVFVTPCVRPGGQIVSKAKFSAQKRRSLVDLQPLARQYGDRVADLHVDEMLGSLPDKLIALWETGAALEAGDPSHASVPERKQALLAYWDSRTDTVWGRRVRAAVETFIRAEVQAGPHAFTTEEIGAFNARRRSETPLDLERSWDEVAADLDMRAGR